MISQGYLKLLFTYEPDTGNFIRNHTIQGGTNCRKGDIAGSNCYKGSQIMINKKRYQASHLVWLYMTGKLPSQEIDHINNDLMDNRFVNLRAHAHDIAQLTFIPHKSNSSGIRGVSWHKRDKKWIAKITIQGKRINLGYFTEIEQAACAYNKAAIQHIKEFYNATN